MSTFNSGYCAMKPGRAGATCKRPEGDRGADLERAARRLVQPVHGVVGERELFEDAFAMLEIRLADFGQPEPAGAAMQQADAERRFEPGDRLADPRLGLAEAHRRTRKNSLALTTWAKTSMSLISCIAAFDCFPIGNSLIRNSPAYQAPALSLRWTTCYPPSHDGKRLFIAIFNDFLRKNRPIHVGAEHHCQRC